MKKRRNISLIAVALAACCFCRGALAQKAEISFTNPSSFHRSDELVVLTRAGIEKRLGAVPNGSYIVVNLRPPIAVQHDDLDGDGRWDEAAFLLSFSPGETKNTTISISKQPMALRAKVRANIHFAKKEVNGYGKDLRQETMPAAHQPNDFTKTTIPYYQVEGPAWENDKVAFRSYFDIRNAKDVFGKTTSAMVMDTVGTYGDKYYHHFDSRWGMDVLKVGKSLGAGALALQVRENGRDTLYRLGGPNMGEASFQKLADGPVRGIFRITYKGWKAGPHTIDLTEEISIWGGQYFYQNTVTVSDDEGKLSAGIVNLKSRQPWTLEKEDCSILYTHDRQSEDSTILGMGIIVKKKDFDSFSSAPNTGDGVTQTYTVVMEDKERPITYRFVAGWERTNSRFADRQAFEDLLATEAVRWSNPVKIKWK
jgi:hypothetical protein